MFVKREGGRWERKEVLVRGKRKREAKEKALAHLHEREREEITNERKSPGRTEGRKEGSEQQ